ncbi:MAG: hypothetical protein WDN00_04410 [Limisphaerales bacterium]
MAMPIGTNNNPQTVQSLLGIPPAGLAVPDSAGYSTNGTPYLYNSSDIIISNSASGGTNFVVYYNNQYNSPNMAVIRQMSCRPIPPAWSLIPIILM